MNIIRQSQPLDRHISRFDNNSLDKAFLTSEKLIFLEGDASQDNFRVESSAFNQVCVLHSRFNVLTCKKSMSSSIALGGLVSTYLFLFSTRVYVLRGVRNLIDFAHAPSTASWFHPSRHPEIIRVRRTQVQTKSRLKLIFPSSISSAFSWTLLQGPYPKEVILDAQFAVGMGFVGLSPILCRSF